jgi:hypothetical protein
LTTYTSKTKFRFAPLASYQRNKDIIRRFKTPYQQGKMENYQLITKNCGKEEIQTNCLLENKHFLKENENFYFTAFYN